VPPEYLIDCGISKEIIFYVFTELNLRLPTNLVTAGIPPYPPPPETMATILFPQSGYPLSTSATVVPTSDEGVARPRSVGQSDDFPHPSAPQGVYTILSILESLVDHPL
jgi:hypothetical protein